MRTEDIAMTMSFMHGCVIKCLSLILVFVAVVKSLQNKIPTREAILITQAA